MDAEVAAGDWRMEPLHSLAYHPATLPAYFELVEEEVEAVPAR